MAAATTGVSRAAVAVLDRATGQLNAAGQADIPFASASVIKVAIAVELFTMGWMSDEDVAEHAMRMIVYSDDVSASNLLAIVGDDVLVRVAARYGIAAVSGPIQPCLTGATGSMSRCAASTG